MSERNPEDDYFTQIDREKKAKMKAKLDEQAQAKALEERKALHWNKCGKCGADMNTKGFKGVEIEVCPECGAVLLDNGELEQLAGEDSSGVLRTMFGSLFGQAGDDED